MTADDALREEIARTLAEHSGWSQSGPDDGVLHLNCFDCGDDLGLERVIVSDWIHRTGKDPAEWNTHGAVPAYDERLAEHQADAILPIVARVEQEAYRRGQVEAWERGYMFAFAQERGDYTHSRPVPDYMAEDIRSWNPYITEETP